MPSPAVHRSLCAGTAVAVTLLSLAGLPKITPALSAQTDLDAFMQAVVSRRDENWRKLQQYILDERDEILLNGPGGTRLWGEQHDYTWFIRDGYFVKSPVRSNGAAVTEEVRRKYEDRYLQFAKRRDARDRQAGPENAPTNSDGAGAIARPDNNDNADTVATLTTVDGLIQQSRQPQFVSSSYFMRFKFDEGRYALAGREKFEGRDVLRIEYYPTRLFENDGGRRGRRGSSRQPTEKQEREAADIRRLMNKVAIVTLWVEPSSHQIVKFMFDNVDLEFLPIPSIVRVDSIKASMTMSQPFPEVWLPKTIDASAAFTLAIGQFNFSQTVAYHDYKEATVKSRFTVK
jgi:hypothetical protein